MKVVSFFFKLVLFLIFNICVLNELSGQEDFGFPKNGTILNGNDIRDYSVILNVEPFEKNQNYWIALATVKNYQANWRTVRNCLLENNCSEKELNNFMESLEIDLFWPKFEVSSSITQGNIFDTLPQDNNFHPRLILLIKATGSQNQYFSNWMSGPTYPGITGKFLGDSVKDQCLIFYRR